MKISDATHKDLQRLESNCNSKSKKAGNYKKTSIVGFILAIICAIIGFWIKDSFWTPFWLSFAGGLFVVSFIIEILGVFLSQLCDMQKLQIISFKIEHNITALQNDTLKIQEPIILEDRGENYVGGIKLEEYKD